MQSEFFEERAAIKEFDGGMSREQAEKEAKIEVLIEFNELLKTRSIYDKSKKN